ncbi:siderophore-interacting protein [Pseudoalteromonas sp. CO302Y]|uniref:siderophore-interacting protein n=1 Tax=unclassified Pseudoalteromonas TaxID=194690 RepID=UPI00102320A3|nr:siderophore-interacting protein [Pseudoalteromonas sp. CO302Y]RZG06161.1 siderophore-interacting protein [Pseudoalteromonas sp. CO133X]
MARKVRRANVLSTTRISPHLQRIVVGSEEFADFPQDAKGAYVKVLLPHAGEFKVELDLHAEHPALMRSYTIRDINPVNGAITLDFVVNQHQGVATNWAQNACVGDEVGIAGPGPKKLTDFTQTHYLMLADLTSVNAINGYLQALPQDATVDVIIHVADKADIIQLEQIEAHSQHSVEWLVTDEPETDLLDQVTRLCAGYNTQPMVFMALEANLVKAIRRLVTSSFAIDHEHIVASAYWKRGIDADGLKVEKQQQSRA